MNQGVEWRIESNDASRVLVQLNTLPKALQRKIKTKITELTNQLLPRVIAREPIRTGRLRRLTHAYVDENPIKMFVRGRVRVVRTRNHNTAAAAGALEYGSTGQRFEVKGHSRRGFAVRGYERAGGISAQRFLRGPAAAWLPRARAELIQVIRDSFKESLKP